MTPPSNEPEAEGGERRSARITLESVLPGLQVGLMLALLPLVSWIFALQIAPLELGISSLTGDVGELRAEFRRMDGRIDDLADRPPNETVMAHIEAILKRLDRLERP